MLGGFDQVLLQIGIYHKRVHHSFRICHGVELVDNHRYVADSLMQSNKARAHVQAMDIQILSEYTVNSIPVKIH